MNVKPTRTCIAIKLLHFTHLPLGSINIDSGRNKLLLQCKFISHNQPAWSLSFVWSTRYIFEGHTSIHFELFWKKQLSLTVDFPLQAVDIPWFLRRNTGTHVKNGLNPCFNGCIATSEPAKGHVTSTAWQGIKTVIFQILNSYISVHLKVGVLLMLSEVVWMSSAHPEHKIIWCHSPQCWNCEHYTFSY